MSEFALISAPYRTITPIIKIVGDYCNLRCSYCFYSGRDQAVRQMMDESLLQEFIRQYLGLFTGKLSFIWHGGEPLLAGIGFFEKIVEFQQRYAVDGQSISNHVQSNGTLMNGRWATFFKTHNFKVGISIDGAQTSHDLFRKGRKGEKTFGKVAKGIGVLREHGIPFGVIQVLTTSGIPRLPENFRFFAHELGLKQWSVNVFLDRDNPEMAHESVTNEQFAYALKTLADLWIKQRDKHLTIREIESFVHGVMGKRTGYCTFCGDCTRYFCLNYDGMIFPCDSFTNEPESALGSLHDGSLLSILNGERRLSYAAKVDTPHSDCVQCQWRLVCNNGCTWLRVGGPDGKYYYCEARKEMFTHMQGMVERCSQEHDNRGRGKEIRYEPETATGGV
jgi:uncharacterized protein